MNSFKQESIRKTMTALLIIAIPLAGLILLGWDINRQTEEIKKHYQDLDNYQRERAILVQLHEQSTKAEDYLKILKNVLPTKDNLFDFKKETERLAAQENIGLAFSFGREIAVTADKPGRMGFTVSAEGSFPKILRFIKAVEGGQFLVEFQSFRFAGLSAKIDGEVFFQ